MNSEYFNLPLLAKKYFCKASKLKLQNRLHTFIHLGQLFATIRPIKTHIEITLSKSKLVEKCFKIEYNIYMT